MTDMKVKLGSLAERVEAYKDHLARGQFVFRFWNQDATLWSGKRAVAKTISNRLGWLTSPEKMKLEGELLTQVRVKARTDGMTHAVVLGMGGSSLCPDVLRRTFGPQPDGLTLHVLDSTEPATIRNLESQIDLKHTLFVVASKSGTTAEPLAFFEHFYARTGGRGDQFLAITDPGSHLATLAEERKFRASFLNPADIGGRFSALSYFGLVPAALMGVDLDRFLKEALSMSAYCHRARDIGDNPGIELGAILAAAAKSGRDKLTFLTSPTLLALGDWIEQLVAESTGKEKTGILPVVGEETGEAGVYGPDRLFVALDDPQGSPGLGDVVAKLEKDHPVIRIEVPTAYHLAGEFFRWEIATAVAGALLEINPFDEPNVNESKQLTRDMLKAYEKDGELPTSKAVDLDGPKLERFLDGKIKPGHFIAILAYLPHEERTERLLRTLQAKLRDRYQVATTLGFGPRFLHSTGQYHKGGPNQGHFIEFTYEAADLEIPGQPYGFGVLNRAQALGDLEALKKLKRKTIHFHLSADPAETLQDFLKGF